MDKLLAPENRCKKDTTPCNYFAFKTTQNP